MSAAPCEACEGRGFTTCEDCRGEGDVECCECHHRTKQCRPCKGYGAVECEACLSLGGPDAMRAWIDAHTADAMPADVRAAVLTLAVAVSAPTEPRVTAQPWTRDKVRWRVEVDARPSAATTRLLTAAGFHRVSTRAAQDVVDGPLGLVARLPRASTWAWFSEPVAGPTDADRRAAGVRS